MSSGTNLLEEQIRELESRLQDSQEHIKELHATIGRLYAADRTRTDRISNQDRLLGQMSVELTQAHFEFARLRNALKDIHAHTAGCAGCAVAHGVAASVIGEQS
jgi:hypothetical protein